MRPQILSPWRPRRETSEFVPWKLVSPVDGESCRWERTDGRWVSLALGHDGELGKVVVADSDGQRELVESYEDALTLARSWRQL
jgi:hypothetical protein